MNMANNLSKEDIARLENVISKVDALSARQEEIIKKVLDGEAKIGERRIGYLKEYFDLYSSKLDTTVARKTSDLSDAFLIVEKQLRESFAEMSAESEKTRKKSGGGGGKPPKTGSGSAQPPGGGSKNKQTVPDAERKKLKEASEEEGRLFADKLTQIYEGNAEALVQEAELKEYIDKRNKKRYDEQKELVDEIIKAESKLAALKREDAKTTLAELRLANQLKASTAEANAQ